MNSTLLKMVKKSLRPGCFIVLCKFFLFFGSLYAQQSDSAKSIVFDTKIKQADSQPKESRLDGIATVSLGNYGGFKSDGTYSSFLQPNIGFEFLAEPGGAFHLLLGGHVGISDPITTGISFGIRQPIGISKNPDIRVYGDLGILFFDFAAPLGQIKYGARLAFGARTIGAVDFEYRLAGEWRGKASDSVDGYRNRTLWWVGAEVGVAFSLLGESKPISRKDSLRASLRYIATSEESDELETVTSEVKLDRWLDRFWGVRDVTPDTKVNEARIEYEKRVETANRMFSKGKKLGVTTDPGRIMLIYGEPNINESDHEEGDEQVRFYVWVYQGRLRDISYGVFIFESDTGQDWQQVYSNVPGELSGAIPRSLPVRLKSWVQNLR